MTRCARTPFGSDNHRLDKPGLLKHGYTMYLGGLPDGVISFKELGKIKGCIYANGTFRNCTGGLIDAKCHKSGWELSNGVKNRQLHISYNLKACELGHCAHQGIVTGYYVVGAASGGTHPDRTAPPLECLQPL